jgi:hypothetical protein
MAGAALKAWVQVQVGSGRDDMVRAIGPGRLGDARVLMNRKLCAGALVGLLLIGGPAAAQAEAIAPSADAVFAATTLDLSAHGETEVTPDRATVTLGVQTTAPTAAQAMAANAGQMTAVFASLRKAGIADRDIRTSNLSLNAQYSYVQDKPPTLTGYQASNDVTVIVNDLSRLGAVVDAATAAGVNQINGVGFGLKDPSAAEDAARLAAVKALAAKAALYANAAGYRVARLVSLSETGGEAPSPPRPMAMMAKMAATPVAAGSLTVRVDVSGVYELAK